MTVVISPPMFLQFLNPNNSGAPAAGFKLFTYQAGTTTKQATWTDSTQTVQNANPIILDSQGGANVWGDPSLTYKFVWAPANDTDPPSSPIRTVDNIAFPVNLTAVANAFYPRTAAEIAASVIPTSLFYPEGDLRRYGGDPTGAADSSAAWQSAISVGIARLAKGCSYMIVTQATKTGQVTILGEGKTSKLLCDGNVLTITSGNNSVVDNFWMENITAPYIITRNPANWSAALTPVQSNGLGYQPTTGDPEYSTWVAGQPLVGTQNIGPTINFTGISTGILVSRIYGRFVRINILDSTYSTVRDCDIQGGKGIFAAILFDNCTNNLQRGSNNKALNNRVYYASFCGITFISNDDGVMLGNESFNNGESGTQTAQTAGFFFTSSVGGASSGTLTAPFTGITASDYQMSFESGDLRTNVTLTNGSTAVTWSPNTQAGNLLQVAAWGHSSLYNNSLIAPMCQRMQIVGNRTYFNYYDGLDCDSTFGTTNGAFRSYHQICDNHSYNNRGDGMNIDGQFGNVSGNTLYNNGNFGIWGVCQNTKIVDNMCIDNNQSRNSSLAEIQASGGPGNKIADNYIWGSSTQNCAGILVTQTSVNYINDNIGAGTTTNNIGNTGVIASVQDGNIDNASGNSTPQSFLLQLKNNGGTLQHIFYADLSAQGPGLFDRINAATSGAFTTTPTGTDGSTAMAGGCKIGSAQTNTLWLDTAAQPITKVAMIAVIVGNSTGTALTVIPAFQAININGVLRQRLSYQIVNATTGVGLALNTTNIAAGKEIDIQFYGRLS